MLIKQRQMGQRSISSNARNDLLLKSSGPSKSSSSSSWANIDAGLNDMTTTDFLLTYNAQKRAQML